MTVEHPPEESNRSVYVRLAESLVQLFVMIAILPVWNGFVTQTLLDLADGAEGVDR